MSSYQTRKPKRSSTFDSITRMLSFRTKSIKPVKEQPPSPLAPAKNDGLQIAGDRWWTTAEPLIGGLISRTPFSSKTGSSPMVSVRRRRREYSASDAKGKRSVKAADDNTPTDGYYVVEITTNSEDYAKQLRRALADRSNFHAEAYEEYIEVGYTRHGKRKAINPDPRAPMRSSEITIGRQPTFAS